MTIETNASQDLPLEDEVAEYVTGGRKTINRPKHLNAGVRTPTVAPQPSTALATSAPVPNTPLPISPFGDDCIPVEDATGAGASS